LTFLVKFDTIEEDSRGFEEQERRPEMVQKFFTSIVILCLLVVLGGCVTVSSGSRSRYRDRRPHVPTRTYTHKIKINSVLGTSSGNRTRITDRETIRDRRPRGSSEPWWDRFGGDNEFWSRSHPNPPRASAPGGFFIWKPCKPNVLQG